MNQYMLTVHMVEGQPMPPKEVITKMYADVEAFNQTEIDQSATFNFTPGVAAAVLFLAITVPLTRFTDWLVERDRRARQAAGVVA